jgi:hypothetical protein
VYLGRLTLLMIFRLLIQKKEKKKKKRLFKIFPCLQMLSGPILVLSIATALSDEAVCTSGTSDGVSDSHTHSEPSSELSSVQSNMDTRYIIEQDDACKFDISFVI